MNQIATFPRDAAAAVPASHPAGHDPSRPVPNPLPKLLTGEDLPIEDSEHLFERLVLGKLEPAEIAGMLIALRMKGETADEMIGAAQALSAAALPFERPDYLYADCCGTGGDGSGLINVSTATAFVAVACGLPVAKHGNRSVSSRCGSADVLEAVGARIDVGPEQARRMLDDTGFCFLFAPAYPPGIKRAALKVVTGGDVEENADRFKALLQGRGSRAEEDIVILNTAALLMTAGKAATLHEGASLARDAIGSGRAAQALDSFVEASRG